MAVEGMARKPRRMGPRDRKTRTAFALRVCACVLLLLMGIAPAGATEAKTQPRDPPGAGRPMNVIFISLDTVRPDHLSCYGYHRRTTPNIDRIAEEGVLFTRAFSQGVNTFPSHLSIFTSRYPAKPWVFWQPEPLDPSTDTLTEILSRHGYHTAAFTNFNRTPYVEPLLTLRPFRAFDRLVGGVALREPPEELFQWLIEHRDRPFFLFLHGFDAHEPHVLPIQYDAKRFDADYQGDVASTEHELRRARVSMLGELREQRLEVFRETYMKLLGVPGPPDPRDLAHAQAVYDAQIYYLDQGLGRVFQALENLDLKERTLLVLFSDHGQAFGEHVQYASHEQCYNEVLQMVLLVRDPRLARRGKRVSQIVQGIDIMPTVLELLGLPIPGSVQGTSLVPLLQTGRDAAREEIAVSVARGMQAIRTPEWKLLHFTDGRTELYHVSKDPGEQDNVHARHPEVSARLQQRVELIIPDEVVGEGVDPEQWKYAHSYW